MLRIHPVAGWLAVALNSISLPVQASSVHYLCYECEGIFTTSKAWYNHRRLSHGIFPASKYLVDGHTCKVCLKIFPSISRIYQHLEQDSQRCLAAWQTLMPSQPPLSSVRLTSAELELVESVRKGESKYLTSLGYRETKSLHPIFRVSGPLRRFHPKRVSSGC